ncbi:transcriptional activator NhaR [Leeia aquatica]|uniref:Transcriptional activator NhaR n=1 Tax=Leeia aquatica TaxID=2725557 RepID=A0A847SES5_9NEIS|nr:transcriptional activator NhaR [Leeia aquatica]NLR75936.1 transcriptional activator NhaR [Leeia aquatica]
MNHLNYKHLRYFWVVAKAGSIARASEQLHVTPQSISGQLAELEEQLGVKLLRRAGRGLELTETGQQVLSYADEIFSLGEALTEALRSGPLTASLPLRVGVADSVAKLQTYRLLQAVLQLDEPVRLTVREGRLSALLGELAVHRLDLVIVDRPMPSNLNVRAYVHPLGDSPLTVFATPALKATLQGTFPQCLHGAPFLLPGEDVAVRSRLLDWLEGQQLRPRIVGEFDDGALLKAFGQAGAGLFVAPSTIADDVCRQHGVEVVGQIEAVKEQTYLITAERRTVHPAIRAILLAQGLIHE